jgi:hypothetical protein
MKSWVRLFVLCLALLPAGLAHAGPADDVRAALQSLRTAIPAPTEWDGIWDTVDSVYICGLPFVIASADTDTICGGTEFTPPVDGTFTCTGTATATTYHFDCTGTLVVDVDCSANVTSSTDGTRTGNTFYIVIESTGTYSGTGWAPLLPLTAPHRRCRQPGEA